MLYIYNQLPWLNKITRLVNCILDSRKSYVWNIIYSTPIFMNAATLNNTSYMFPDGSTKSSKTNSPLSTRS